MASRSHSQYPARRRPPKKRSRGPLLALVALLALAGAGLLALAVWWPAARITASPSALATVTTAPAGETLASVSVLDASGRRVPVRIRSGSLWPVGKLPAGERLEVRATIRRSSLVSWLLGATEHVEATVVTPSSGVAATLLHLAPGAPVNLHFAGPASLVSLKLPGYKPERLSFTKPRHVLQTGLRASGSDRFGVLAVATAARSWELLAAPTHVSWFPAGTRLQAVVSPSPGATIEPSTPIRLTFSEPVATVLGSVRPTLEPATPGSWVEGAANALTFVPTGAGYPLGKPVVVTLPAPVDVLGPGRTETVSRLSFSVPVGSTLRLQQLLSGLGYLPLDWTAAGAPVPRTALAQEQAALKAPAGSFTWRYPNTPAPLQDLWKAGAWTRMTQAAVMAFESDHGLAVDGIPGPIVWHTLIRAALGGDQARSYSYVLVHRTVPQNLILWNDGETILQTRVNTGVPGAPTPYGTHAVFEHIPVGTMTGVNPDGTHYHDPGIRWISYFNGGEAIHGFNRASYGFPQSVGCVETPISTAAEIWPYTPVGTLVTIAP